MFQLVKSEYLSELVSVHWIFSEIITNEAYLFDDFNGVIIQVSDFDELEGYLNFLKDWITKKPSPISWEFIECP